MKSYIQHIFLLAVLVIVYIAPQQYNLASSLIGRAVLIALVIGMGLKFGKSAGLLASLVALTSMYKVREGMNMGPSYSEIDGIISGGYEIEAIHPAFKDENTAPLVNITINSGDSKMNMPVGKMPIDIDMPVESGAVTKTTHVNNELSNALRPVETSLNPLEPEAGINVVNEDVITEETSAIESAVKENPAVTTSGMDQISTEEALKPVSANEVGTVSEEAKAPKQPVSGFTCDLSKDQIAQTMGRVNGIANVFQSTIDIAKRFTNEYQEKREAGETITNNFKTQKVKSLLDAQAKYRKADIFNQMINKCPTYIKDIEKENADVYNSYIESKKMMNDSRSDLAGVINKAGPEYTVMYQPLMNDDLQMCRYDYNSNQDKIKYLDDFKTLGKNSSPKDLERVIKNLQGCRPIANDVFTTYASKRSHKAYFDEDNQLIDSYANDYHIKNGALKLL